MMASTRLRRIDTSIGYERKPKHVPGYSRFSEYCECGCKQSYWYYQKIATPEQVRRRKLFARGNVAIRNKYGMLSKLELYFYLDFVREMFYDCAYDHTATRKYWKEHAIALIQEVGTLNEILQIENESH